VSRPSGFVRAAAITDGELLLQGTNRALLRMAKGHPINGLAELLPGDGKLRPSNWPHNVSLCILRRRVLRSNHLRG
jgi:hypothetical protein